MRIYADTSVFVSLYISDAHSEKADIWRQRHPIPLALTLLHQLEFRNALSLAVFQKRLSMEQSAAAWQRMQRDSQSSVLLSQTAPWTEVFREAEDLAARHTPAIGSRALDVLHVAAAKVLSAEIFISFDTRQIELATLAKLHAVHPS